MGKSALAPIEKLIIDKFRELSDDGKQRLVNYAELLYQEEKKLPEIELDDFFTEEERKSLSPIIEEVQEFLKSKPKKSTQEVLREMSAGVFESEEDFATNHDFYLYGATKRK